MAQVDFKKPEYYFNRELSLLKFQARVLAQAKDEHTPLLERLRFLCISSTNLDEFFEIRVAGLKHKAALASLKSDADGLTAQQCLEKISIEAHILVAEQYRVLNEELIPALSKKKVRFLPRQKWDQKKSSWIKRIFNNEILPVLSPLGLDPAHPFPRVNNKSLNFIISLDGKDAFGRDSRIAIVQAPRSLSRMIQLPESLSNRSSSFVFLSSVIHAHIDDLFPGMKVSGCYQFRVTRDSDLFVDGEEIDDLMGAIKGEISAHRLGDTTRLEVADNCPDEISDFLLKEFKLGIDDLYKVNGPVNLNRLVEAFKLIDNPELLYKPFNAGMPRRLQNTADILEVIRNGDVLLHHPFESFAPVVEMIRQAALDPHVKAIKQTLYRTGAESPLVDALVEAARRGKEVTIVVELRARFDEEENIRLASRLQDAGAHVVYGVVGYKTHAKMLLIVRREGRKYRRYIHLGTGNYHTETSRVYTDFGMLSCDAVLAEDVHRLFIQLTGLGRATKLKKILQSPFTLHKNMILMIQNEIDVAQQGRQARIIAKMNSLVEPSVIEMLYRASCAGVVVDLIVRGACCLRPGIDGVSENITVRSIVGRFLEHSRIYYFHNDGDEKVFGASADWMERNLFRRVETCFPIEEAALKKHIIMDGLMPYLSDNTQAWLLLESGSYKKLKPGNQKPKCAQAILLERLSAKS